MRGTLLAAAVMASLSFAPSSDAGAILGSAFTYQGQLKSGGAPADGTFHLRFQLWNALVGGAQVGADVDAPAVAASEGLFTLPLDFGSDAFDGSARWLEVQVITGGGATITTLTPRQPVTATPYALYALQTRGIFVDSAENVGIGTTNPQAKLHVNGGVQWGGTTTNFARSNEDASGLFLEQKGASPATSKIRMQSSKSGDLTNYSQFFIDPNVGFSFMTLGTGSGDVGIGTTSPQARLHVVGDIFSSGGLETNGTIFADGGLAAETVGATVALFNRIVSDGILVAFRQDGLTEGTISVAGTTVSYNAFTGSHYGWTDRAIERGTLVVMTGQNRRRVDDPAAEPIYGIIPSTTPNDPRCLGAYLGVLEPGQPPSLDNPHQIMVVGNGDMWVVDDGRGDIEPGEYLISSSVPGCAMKDDPARFSVGHIVAQAAERVHWNDIPTDETGFRRARISVLFEKFDRHGGAESLTGLQETVAAQGEMIAALQRELLSLRGELTAVVGKRGAP